MISFKYIAKYGLIASFVTFVYFSFKNLYNFICSLFTMSCKKFKTKSGRKVPFLLGEDLCLTLKPYWAKCLYTFVLTRDTLIWGLVLNSWNNYFRRAVFVSKLQLALAVILEVYFFCLIKLFLFSVHCVECVQTSLKFSQCSDIFFTWWVMDMTEWWVITTKHKQVRHKYKGMHLVQGRNWEPQISPCYR